MIASDMDCSIPTKKSPQVEILEDVETVTRESDGTVIRIRRTVKREREVD
jgi:hypothetical protein